MAEALQGVRMDFEERLADRPHPRDTGAGGVVLVTGSLFVLCVVLLAFGFILLLMWAADERARYEEDAAKQRRLISELQKHPASDGTAVCPYCKSPVEECFCDWQLGK